MNVLFLTNNLDVTRPLYDWLCETEGTQNIRLWEAPLSVHLFSGELRGAEFIVSYNYRHIIKCEIIDLFPQRIINLHTSMLPWNRGASPNFWSFIDDTPKGVTIHLVDKGVDTGDILCQRQVIFDEKKETLASSYNRLHEVIQTLFRENWVDLKQGIKKPRKQGSYHTQSETDEIIGKFSIKWTDNVNSVKSRINHKLPKSGGGGANLFHNRRLQRHAVCLGN